MNLLTRTIGKDRADGETYNRASRRIVFYFIITGILISVVRDCARFAGRHHFAPQQTQNKKP